MKTAEEWLDEKTTADLRYAKDDDWVRAIQRDAIRACWRLVHKASDRVYAANAIDELLATLDEPDKEPSR